MKRILAALVLALTIGTASYGAPLYGVTENNLVIINPTTANIVSTVGPLGLPQGTFLGNLTYHPGHQMLYGIALRTSGGVTTNQYLAQVNPSTGAASLLATLGAPGSVGYFEALEYVHALDSLVASRTNVPNVNYFVSDHLVKLALDGTATPLVVTPGVDHDQAVYDQTRNLFYTNDSNNPDPNQRFFRIDLSSGTVLNLPPIPYFMREMAYSPAFDAIFAVEYPTNVLYRVQLTNGGAPITITTVGTIPGPFVWGIAFASTAVIPEPSSLALFTIAVVSTGLVYLRRRTRSVARLEE